MVRSLAAVVVLVALGIGGEAASGQESQKAQIIDHCRKGLNVPDSVCDCIGGKAEADLTEEERAMVIATISRNKTEAAKLRASMPGPSLMKSGTFLTQAPGECAKEKEAASQ